MTSVPKGAPVIKTEQRPLTTNDLDSLEIGSPPGRSLPKATNLAPRLTATDPQRLHDTVSHARRRRAVHCEDDGDGDRDNRP